MKYHCQADQKDGEGIRALCGFVALSPDPYSSVIFSPDTYICRSKKQFDYCGELRCKRCLAILNKQNGGK